MAGRNPHEAVTNFLEPIRSVLTCVTDGVLNGERPRPGSVGPYKANLNGGMPARLSGSGLFLTLAMSYDVVEADGERGPWKVQSLEYAYHVIQDDGKKLVGWHWHPLQTPDRAFPHVHAYSATQPKLHLPTGRVAIEQVALMAIHDLGVRPRRPGASVQIRSALQRFETYRTWP